MLSSQKGFAPILLILGFILASGLIIGGSFYLKQNVIKNDKQSQTVNPPTTIAQPTKSPSVTPVAINIATNSAKPRDFVVKGSSMNPNYLTGQVWLYEPYNNEQPKRLDIVIFDNPVVPGNIIDKRIIGLPNEKVKVANSHVYINDQLLPEAYTSTPTTTASSADKPFIVEGQEKIIPASTYFVLGDNRPASNDSRNWGTLAREKIIGKLTQQIQPLPMPSPPENCSCLDKDNNLCLPQIACQ